MQRVLFLKLLLLYLVSGIIYGSNNNLHFDIEKFIPQLDEESVISVYRDSQGYLWVGTYIGLFCTDGTDTHVYLNDPSDNHSINSSIIFSIFEDSKGRLWFGTQRGLDQYDHESDNFIHHIPKDVEDTWTYKEIRDIEEDQNGNLWLASYNHHGLIKYNPETKIEDVYWVPGIEELRLNTIEIDSNTLWIGIEFYGLFSMNLENDSITNILSFEGNKSLTINDIKIVDKVLWIGTWNNGLISYNPANKNTIWYHKNIMYSNQFSGKNIRQIAVDNEKNLWLAVYGDGINFFNTEKKTVKVITDKNKITSHSKSLNSWCIYIDNQNILWSGSMETGLIRFFINTIKHDFLTFSNKGQKETITNITAAIQDKNDFLWIGTKNQGLIKYNLKSKTGHKIKLQPTINDLHIVSMMIDSLNHLWVSTNNGIFIIEPKSTQIISYLNNENSFLRKIINPVNIMYCDRDGDVWLSAWQAGLIHIPYSQLKNLKTTDYKPNRYLTINNNNAALLNNNVVNIFQSSDSTIWVSGSYFIQKFSKKTQIFEVFSWYDGSRIVEDNENHLWISSNILGVIDYNPVEKTSNIYGNDYSGTTNAAELLSEGNNIWLNRKNELIKIDYINNKVEYYKIDAGIKKLQSNLIGVLLNDNNILLGGVEGCYIFNPSKVNSTLLPKIRPSHIYIYNKVVGVNDTIDGTIVQTNKLEEEEKIVIPAGIKSFSVEFSSIDFINADNAVYAYRLLGFDTTWTFLDSPNRSAIFTNLDGGEYTLQMALLSPFSDWKNNAHELKIKVLIPFYKTNWFRITVLLTIVFLILAIILLRQYRLNKRNLELEKIVSKRTSELQKSNKDLRKKTERLNKVNSELVENHKFIKTQTIKIEEQKKELEVNFKQLLDSNATKDKFLSIIAHDLKSPFNTILGFLEILYDAYDDFSDKTRKKMLQNAFYSSQVVYDLVENLLIWARSKKGEMEFNPKQINIQELIAYNIKVASVSSNGKNIKLSTENNISELSIHADKDMLNFILRNLLSNSIKFTPKNGHVNISVVTKEKELILCVKDNGIGINKQKIKTLFESSELISTMGTNNEKGTGLGLLLCKDFVKRHKGKIWVESVVDKGSSFYISLPVINEN